MPEDILEPDLPIIDPHHHLWDLRRLQGGTDDDGHPFVQTAMLNPYYNFDTLLADATSGHRVIGTVFMECGAYYRADAGPALSVVGEVEYVNGVAAQGASGAYGDFRPCAAIVGHADLMLGRDVREVLEALDSAGNGRFRGIRHRGAWDEDTALIGHAYQVGANAYLDPRFREGFAILAEMGFTFDAWVLEPQIGDVTDLARAFPDAPIILDHCGTPLNFGSYKGRLHERFDLWRDAIRELATCPNVTIKLGGLGMAFCGMPDRGPDAGLPSATLAAMWRPYIETSIEAFGPDRCMFESNFPVERWAADYRTLWNAFKHITLGASASELRALYAGTAARIYGIEHLLRGL